MLRVRSKGSKQEVFDCVRNSWVSFTPEEQVRQSVIVYLQKSLHVPRSFIGVEYSLSNLVKDCRKQLDIIVFRPSHSKNHLGLSPWLIVECKAQSVKIDNKILTQVLGYVEHTRPDFIMVTNGTDSRFFVHSDSKYAPCEQLPVFKTSEV